uniref:C2H2-type domain-containing protein n=1 Tax=Timema poppense TaxID=170557 RepID=A0A7R9DR87_TIMPO|nr:unnamed protein product [Timema poppensis]
MGSTGLPVNMSSQTWLKTMTTALTSETPGVDLKNNHCISCKLSFLSSFELKMHNVIYHNFRNRCNLTQRPTATTSRSSIKKPSRINPSDTYPCVPCDKSFKNQYLFNRHNAAYHSSNMCNVCGKQFNKQIDYKVHMKRFVDTQHFACDHCNATFKDESNLIRHEQTHTDDKRLVCRFCNYSAYTITKINNHERKHTGNYRHHCKVCKKGYNSLQNLESHNISVHSAEPHKCSICGKLYTSKYRYRRHLLEHKPNYIPENKFQCDTCGQTFKRAPILKKHMVCHLAVKPYECNQCGKRVTRKSSLKNHMRTHTGERPAVCNVCGKAFPSPYLSTHMRSHTGAKPFTCTTCDKSFTQRSTLVI